MSRKVLAEEVAQGNSSLFTNPISPLADLNTSSIILNHRSLFRKQFPFCTCYLPVSAYRFRARTSTNLGFGVMPLPAWIATSSCRAWST